MTSSDQDRSPNVLDVPQLFESSSSFAVRDELQNLISRDLLGPFESETERFPHRAAGPRERYLVGMLGPKHQPKTTTDDADQATDTEFGVGGETSGEGSGELPERQTLGKIWASSMGLSFRVSLDADTIVVTVSWGQYIRESAEDEEGRTRTSWVREPISHQREIDLTANPNQRIPLVGESPDQPGVYLAVAVRDRPGHRTVEVTLVNNQTEPASTADTAWLFQTKLEVTALDGASPIFLPIDDPLDEDDAGPSITDYEEQHLRLLYKDQLKFANGHNVAVHPQVTGRRAHKLETTWLPTYDVAATSADASPGTSLAGVELGMDALAIADADTLRGFLQPLADGYDAWLTDRENEIPTLPASLRATAETAVLQARRAAKRIRSGIELLTDPSQEHHADALKAFAFTNRAMAEQRRHTEIGRLREQKGISYPEALDEVKERGPKVASWRPFQLAFVLLNLPAITNPDHPERAANHDALVDLLFFPTGGGKTEAYLGLTAYTFAIRRLQGVVGSGEDARSGLAGVAVLMRYTLRLLTAQQFQRAAALVCACELIRREDWETWGAKPFRIGLWVGGGVSPNWFPEAEEQISAAREAGHGKRANVLQTLSCPWCGESLKAHRDVITDPQRRRVLLYCDNSEGPMACPFSRSQGKDGLPIVTVDEEIYRLLPSLVIATVDKFAQLPWRGYAGMLFGRVDSRCPRHGYRHPDLDKRIGCADRHNRSGNLSAVSTEPVVRLRPPDLIIQDELHLISGALGTTVGLFESAVDQLSTWRTPSGKETGPKIIASTATTKRAAEQVRGVFGRSLQIFPPQVTDVADTFFSKQVPVTEETPGRRYMGICAHGVRLKSAEIRVAEILLLAGQTLFDKYGAAADPYMSMVGYFNATRELAGMRRYIDDDVATRVRRHGRAKGLSDRLILANDMINTQELTSRISSGDISEVLKRLEVGFDPEFDTTGRRRAIGDDWREVLKARRSKSKEAREPHSLSKRWSARPEDRRPVDVVLATSMLQVGVDVSRWGVMLLVGQPKNTAEYIQASSRVGRDARRPGLVVTLYNWTRPRDLAHYEDFEHYHATFYRQVEALSVTPFTRRSLDRGTAAMFVAAVRNAVAEHSRNADAHSVDLDGPIVQDIVQRLLDRAEFVDQLNPSRGRSYLLERINVLKDTWNRRRSEVHGRLGYDKSSEKGQRIVELLVKPGEQAWSTTTAGMSMRETENEINLLLPANHEFEKPLVGAPDWMFGEAEKTEDADADVGDEVGESSLEVSGTAK